MISFDKDIDLSNVMPKGVKFKIENKEYELVYSFGALKRLGEAYGTVGAAIDALSAREEPYDLVVNFLYCGLCDKYKLTKQDIEEWVGVGSVNLLYNLIFSAIMSSFGHTDGVNEESAEGEA